MIFMYREYINKLLLEHANAPAAFKKNIVKEYLQVLALSFIYSHKDHQDLLFYGGSCLRHCFGLERLSEDLDFVDLTGHADQVKLAKDLVEFYGKELDVKIASKCQKFRTYLKFPILHELGLADRSGSNDLFIKVEVYRNFDYCSHFETQVVPLFKFGRTLLIKTFDLPTLMATKIRAALFRKWEKTRKGGETIYQVKGRDYFDLMWYLNKGVRPNLECLKDEVKGLDDLKGRILNLIEKLDLQSVKLDLEGFIEDGDFIENLSRNLKDILANQIKNL